MGKVVISSIKSVHYDYISNWPDTQPMAFQMVDVDADIGVDLIEIF